MTYCLIRSLKVVVVVLVLDQAHASHDPNVLDVFVERSLTQKDRGRVARWIHRVSQSTESVPHHASLPPWPESMPPLPVHPYVAWLQKTAASAKTASSVSASIAPYAYEPSTAYEVVARTVQLIIHRPLHGVDPMASADVEATAVAAEVSGAAPPRQHAFTPVPAASAKAAEDDAEDLALMADASMAFLGAATAAPKATSPKQGGSRRSGARVGAPVMNRTALLELYATLLPPRPQLFVDMLSLVELQQLCHLAGCGPAPSTLTDLEVQHSQRAGSPSLSPNSDVALRSKLATTLEEWLTTHLPAFRFRQCRQLAEQGRLIKYCLKISHLLDGKAVGDQPFHVEAGNRLTTSVKMWKMRNISSIVLARDYDGKLKESNLERASNGRTRKWVRDRVEFEVDMQENLNRGGLGVEEGGER